MVLTKSGKRLEDLIKKAIEDHVITKAEYEEIIHVAHDDNVIDAHEKILLKEFQELLADRTIKRVP